MCGGATVEGSERDRIAALNATFREVSKSPFGDDDHIGMLNLMTSDSMRTVLSQIDGHKVFDLAVDYFIGMPSWTASGEPPYQASVIRTPRGNVIDNYMGLGPERNELVASAGETIAMYTHCGTHIDTLCHFGYHGTMWNGNTAGDHLGSRGWDVLGAEHHPPMVARGLLIDVAGLKGVDILPDGYGIGSQDLRDALRKQQTDLRVGDVALVRTGRQRKWPEFDAYINNAPGVTREGAEFVARSGAITIGADTCGLEQGPSQDPDNPTPVHTYLFAEAGVPIIEVLDLEALAADHIYEFAFVGACLKLKGATGSPIRPLAFPLRRK